MLNTARLIGILGYMLCLIWGIYSMYPVQFARVFDSYECTTDSDCCNHWKDC